MEKIIRDSFLPSNRTVGIDMVLPFYDFLRRFSILLIPPLRKGTLGGIPICMEMTELRKCVN
jgi:hypothetical protein